MREIDYTTIGVLPVSNLKWHVREGGGHIWFVNEDELIPPYVIYEGLLRPVVDVTKDETAPLIMPVYA